MTLVEIANFNQQRKYEYSLVNTSNESFSHLSDLLPQFKELVFDFI